MAQVGVLDEAEFLEQLQGPIDRGDVDAGHGLAQLLGRGMAQLAHGRQHELALWRHPQSALVQSHGQVVGHRLHPRVAAPPK